VKSSASQGRHGAAKARDRAPAPGRDAAAAGEYVTARATPMLGAEASDSTGGRRDSRIAAVQAMADRSTRTGVHAKVQAMGDRATESARAVHAAHRPPRVPAAPVLQGKFALVGVASEADKVTEVLSALGRKRAWLIEEDAALVKSMAPEKARKHRSAADVLDDKRLPDVVKRMHDAETDHGHIDLGNDMMLLQLFYRLTLELGPGEARDTEEKLAQQEAKQSAEAWTTWVEALVGKHKAKQDQIFRTVVLGRGASAAYVIENGGVPLDATTLVIGQEQPWRKERGSQGVINHPHNMIDPKHPDFDGTDDGLAERIEFSNRVDEVFKRLVTPPRDAKVGKVQKQGAGADAHYVIETDPGGPVYAQRVVAAMGIGKHDKPKKLTSDVAHDISPGIPRIMDMDAFQRLVADGKLDAAKVPLGIVVVGPNAAIDVMSTGLRSEIKPLYWVTGKRPFFLKGTDNEFVEQTYDGAMKHQEQKDDARDKRYAKDGFTVIQNDHLSATTMADGVEVEYGIRENDRAVPKVEEQPIGKQKASILVYGIGPDVAGLMGTFPGMDDKTLEPVYDLGLHFNEDTPDAKSIETAIRKRSGEKADAVVDAVKKILGGLDPVQRPSDAKLEADAPRTNLPKSLPSVLGLRAAKADPEDPTSLEFTSGMAYRFAVAAKPKYRYLSTQLDGLLGGEIKKLAGTVEALAGDLLTNEIAIDVGVLANETGSVATAARALVAELEEGKRLADLDTKLDALTKRVDGMAERVKKITQALAGISASNKTASDAGHHVRDVPPRLRQILAQTREFGGRVASDKYGHLASSHMEAPARTLPANVVLADQLTTSRATVESRQEKLPPTVAKGVDFITHDHTIIADHVASAYPTIPAVLADHVTAKIVHDRRFLPLDQAPLPRPNEALGPENTFHLKQQQAFQQTWTDKLRQVAALFPNG
jgi:hypothetical protein